MAHASSLRQAAVSGRRQSCESARHSHLRVRCTKDGDNTCLLLQHSVGINEVLLGAGLELREDERRIGSGGVRLVVAKARSCGYTLWRTPEYPEKRTALQLAEDLLTEHRCVTALEICCNAPYPSSLLEAIKCSPTVESVTIRGYYLQDHPGNPAVFETVNCLTHLQELIFKADRQEHYLGGKLELAGDLFPHPMQHLTTLDVADLDMTLEHKRRLFSELMLNGTLTDLTVGEGIFCSVGSFGEALFERYLTKEDSKLKILTLKAIPANKDPRLMNLAEVLGRMTTLEELHFDFEMEPQSFAEKTVLIAASVLRCPTLRSLRLPSMVCTECCGSGHYSRDRDAHDEREGSHWMRPMLEAVRSEHCGLRNLRIDLSDFHVDECHEFFGAVRDNRSLNCVAVHHLPDDEASHLRTIRELGLSGRVIVEDNHVNEYHYRMNKYSLSHCAEIRSVTIDRSHYAGMGETDLEPLRVGLVDLARWSHVTSVSLRCSKFDRPTFDALADYLRASHSLTDVEINVLEFQSVWISDGQMSEEDWTEVRSRITAALVALPKLRTLRLIDLDLSSTNLRTLLERARQTRMLTEFHRNPSCSYEPMCKLLHKRLLHGDPADSIVFPLDDSCSRHADQRAHDAEKQTLAALQDAVSRNASLFRAGVRFVVEGSCDEDFDAWRGVELFHDNNDFLKLVGEAADVDGEEARKMADRALRFVRNCDVHTFMRAAGVVRDSVECISQHGAQLSSLNFYCWLHVRSYLTLVDIVGD